MRYQTRGEPGEGPSRLERAARQGTFWMGRVRKIVTPPSASKRYRWAAHLDATIFDVIKAAAEWVKKQPTTRN